jgi:hypothetical protein
MITNRRYQDTPSIIHDEIMTPRVGRNFVIPNGRVRRRAILCSTEGINRRHTSAAERKAGRTW